MTANERYSEVNVVRRCFPERSNSIASVFSREPLRVKPQNIDLKRIIIILLMYELMFQAGVKGMSE